MSGLGKYNITRFMRLAGNLEDAALAYGKKTMLPGNSVPLSEWREVEDKLTGSRQALREEAVEMLTELSRPPPVGPIGPVLDAVDRFERAVVEVERLKPLGGGGAHLLAAKTSAAAEEGAARRNIVEAISRWRGGDGERPRPSPPKACRFVEEIRDRLYDGRGRLKFQPEASLAYAVSTLTVGDFDRDFGPPPDELGDLLDGYEHAVRDVQDKCGKVNEAELGRLIDVVSEKREAVRAYHERSKV